MAREAKNIRRRGKRLHYRFQKNGKEYQGPLDTSEVGVAKERRDRKRQELVAAKWGETGHHTFDDAVDKFIKDHFPNLKPSTQKRYGVSIANLTVDFHQVQLDNIGSAQLASFVSRRKREEVKTPTIRRDLSFLSVLCTFAVGWEWIKENRVKAYIAIHKGTKALKDSDQRTRHLDHEEEGEVLRYAAKKARRAIIFAIDSGLRKAEQFGLRWPDVDLVKRRIHVRRGLTKGDKERFVPIQERTLQLLKDMRKQRDLRCHYVFATQDGQRYSETSPTHYEALQRAVKNANKARAKAGRDPIEHVEWHDLRRTCGCRLLQDLEFEMKEVSVWLGHTSVAVTERHYAFLKVDNLQKRLERKKHQTVEIESHEQVA
jgi:integrase